MKPDGFLGIVMRGDEKLISHADLHAEFLNDFALERRAVRFAGFHLSPRKFPQTR
ncbi:hypothetical protein D3C83_274450 [compost metagenome]